MTTFKALQERISEMNLRKGWTQDLLKPLSPEDERNEVEVGLSGIAMIHVEHSNLLEEIRKTGRVPEAFSKLRDPFPEGPLRSFQFYKVLSKLALVHSEVSEAVASVLKGELGLVYYSGEGADPRKPEGLASELADVVIRVIHLADMLNIDLFGAIRVKLAYNDTRAFKHGGKHA